MIRNLSGYLILFSLILTSCRPTATQTPLATPTEKPASTGLPMLEGRWSLRLVHSGGIMGLSRSLVISADGKYWATDERTGKTYTGLLSAEEFSKIKELIASAEYEQTTQPEMTCADCFIYELQILSNGEKFYVQLNDLELPKSGLESLITTLRNIMSRTIK